MAAKSTITSTSTTTTTSTTGSTSDKVANQTTAAVADFFGVSLGVTEDSTGAFKLNVLANDPGSATLLGLYTYAPSTPSKSLPLTASTVNGATVTIKDGAVFYQSTPTSSAKFQHLAAGATATDSFAYVIKMSNGALSTAVATVTVLGQNDDATITSVIGELVSSLSEDQVSISGGSITVADVDDFEAVMTGATGKYGSISFEGGVGAAQQWTYKLNSDAQTLIEKESFTETLVVKSADGTASKTINVTVMGANDTATISGTSTAAITEDDGKTAESTVSVSDVDRGQNVFGTATSSVDGIYGKFSFDQGKWSFSLNEKAQSLTEGKIVEQRLVVTSVDGTASKEIVVTITGVNDAAEISGDLSAEIGEDGAGASGKLEVTDKDEGQSGFQRIDGDALQKHYGDFSFVDGDWTFTQNGEAQTLAEGDEETERLTVTSVDGTSKTILVTITGANDDAEFGGDDAVVINEDDVGASGKKLTVSDIDHDQSSFQEVNSDDLAGTYGDFSFDNGAWSFMLNDSAQTLNARTSVTETLTIKSLDNTEKLIRVTITGVNDRATIDGEAAATIDEEGAGVRGALSVEDVDEGEKGFQSVASVAGRYGSFTFDNGAWTFTLNDKAQALAEGETATEELTVASIDGSAEKVIVVTINGVNDKATISGVTSGVLTEDGVPTVHAALSVSDADRGEDRFAAVADSSLVGQYGTFTFDEISGHWGYTQGGSADQAARVQRLNSGQNGTDYLTVSSLDGSSKATITVTVQGQNEPTIFKLTMGDFKQNPTQTIVGFTDNSILEVPHKLNYDGATTSSDGLDLNFSFTEGKKTDFYDVILVGVTSIDATAGDGDPSQIIQIA